MHQRIRYYGFLKNCIISSLLCCLCIISAGAQDQWAITGLKTEYADRPVGMNITRPQFSWMIGSDRPGLLQEAYRVLVSDDSTMLQEEEANMWDSKQLKSAQSAGVAYNGLPLKSRTRYYWKVQVQLRGAPAGRWSPVSFFETGLLDQKEWTGDWVGYSFGWPGKVLYFRHVFDCAKPVAQARIYVAGIGYNTLRLNGHRVGDRVLEPANSDYAKRVYYSTYDVTAQLKDKNVLLVAVAPGWYGMPKLRLQADIIYTDGSRQQFSSTDIRRVTQGPVQSAGVIDGEQYDARLEKFEEWDIPSDTIIKGLPNKHWGYALTVEPPGGKMVAQHQEPIRIIEALHPVSVTEIKPGVLVLDAGQNGAGWLELSTAAKAGTEIVMKFAETLNPDGSVNQENLRTARATDVYIAKGTGREVWEPSFTYHGFRYIQVEGMPGRPGRTDFRIKRVRSDVAETGTFSSSSKLLNAIHQMVQRTEASNLHSIPTDCPQRDERMGWLNDMTVRIDQAIYNFDMSRFYPKYLDDISDTQDEEGRIGDTAPYKVGGRPADPVSVSYLLLAIKCYEYYGNRTIIDKHYSGFKAWVRFLQSQTKDGILEYSYYGDWSPPAELGLSGAGYGAISKNTPGSLMSTGFLYYYAQLMERMAVITGRKEDAQSYATLARITAAAFQERFWNASTGGYGSNNQACNAFALFLGMGNKAQQEQTLQNLVADVKAQGYHLTTGNICTKYLLEVLTERGQVDVAYKIATQTTYPGWGYMLEKGATTLWERWEYQTGSSMNSHNHPMMGSVGSWFYKYLLGIIPDENNPGFQRFIIKPYMPRGLESCAGSYHSVTGMINSRWKKGKDKIEMNVTVPANSVAEVFIPSVNGKITVNGKSYTQNKNLKLLRTEAQWTVFEVASGDYEFMTFKTN
ncbi:alpha-L-rhamnosidase [Niabella sp.]|uniref:alpha-L-rhamnosidase n=1 Tax=Niabella sp. TaxID=1962976 RepID=UPI0026212363|nr:alpha-L-rhamnosidase [Niabella sp.]